jgi:hypothetical protein
MTMENNKSKGPSKVRCSDVPSPPEIEAGGFESSLDYIMRLSQINKK